MQQLHQTSSYASLAHPYILSAAPGLPNDCSHIIKDVRWPLQAVRAARGIDPDLSSLFSDLDLGDIADDLGLDLSGSLSLDLPSESLPSLPSPAIDFMEALQGNFSATVSCRSPSTVRVSAQYTRRWYILVVRLSSVCVKWCTFIS